MAQIGTVRLETQNSGVVDVPVFEPGDSASGIYEFVRVETASGPGFIPVTDPVDATYPYLRVQSQNNGIVAVTDTPGSDIPDSEVLDDWADGPTVTSSAITDRQTFDSLAYQGPDPTDRFNPVGSRPEWTIDSGSVSISSNQLSLSTSAVLNTNSAQNRGLYRASAAVTTTGKGSFNIFTHTDTPSNPTGGNGYAITLSFITSRNTHAARFVRYDNGSETTLINADGVTDTTLSTQELIVDESGVWTYSIDGSQQGQVTDSTHLDKPGISLNTNVDRDDAIVDFLEVYPSQ